jgi:putative addiction module component (TIGR02574 family)
VTDEAGRILDAALQLPEAERLQLAAILTDSVGDKASPEEVEAAWIAEAKRRSTAIERGEMELVDSDAMMARLRARIRRAQERQASTG